MYHLKKLFSLAGIFTLYILGFLLLGEAHPFSRFRMYSNFPNWSYAFYVTDGRKEMIPLKPTFNAWGWDLGHMYSSICDYHGYNYGYNMETPEDLQAVGNEMIDRLLEKNPAPLQNDTLFLYRRFYFVEQDSINFIDTEIGKQFIP